MLPQRRDSILTLTHREECLPSRGTVLSERRMPTALARHFSDLLGVKEIDTVSSQS